MICYEQKKKKRLLNLRVCVGGQRSGALACSLHFLRSFSTCPELLPLLQVFFLALLIEGSVLITAVVVVNAVPTTWTGDSLAH